MGKQPCANWRRGVARSFREIAVTHKFPGRREKKGNREQRTREQRPQHVFRDTKTPGFACGSARKEHMWGPATYGAFGERIATALLCQYGGTNNASLNYDISHLMFTGGRR